MNPITLATGFLEILKSIGTSKSLEASDDLDKLGVDVRAGDLARLNSNFVIEPDIYYTQTLKDTEHIDRINDILGNLFTANFLKGFNIMVNVAGMSASTAFDLLSTKTSFDSYKATSSVLAMMSFEDDVDGYVGLPINGDYTVEAKSVIDGKYDNDDLAKIVTAEADVTYDIVRDGVKTEVTVPLMVKTTIRRISSKSLYSLVEDKGFLETLTGRFMEARSGGITWTNFFWPTDLAAKYKAKRLDAIDDLYESISDQEATSASKLLSSGGRGMALNYGMYVITASELTRLEALSGLKMHKHKHADEILDKLRAFTMAVVDDDYTVVDIYIKAIKGKSSIKYSNLAKKKSGGGNDELIKALISNRPPVF